MSTNELRQGVEPARLVWPDDREMATGEHNVMSMTVVEVPGEYGNVPWIKAVFGDSSTALVNPSHLALIIFGEE